ncbi:hypothetical protein Poly59_26750 [Rubripirellula reticaptiva]|uniref:Uncharacterized protein n=1 Tax=Rubripirellula reticaptiva TaxID=2528013 RepID=A0A5C6FA03_9BACT|nr:hypothetical protein Poly59_26750 [Rubripirellula reticaptiva]
MNPMRKRGYRRASLTRRVGREMILESGYFVYEGFVCEGRIAQPSHVDVKPAIKNRNPTSNPVIHAASPGQFAKKIVPTRWLRPLPGQ